ncbi:TonB-dependent receptor [Pontibacter sp. E15-1]|uniref:SusC/RagA family TonB-linked outer membrane protein n=1 Tax=Pontibacter sp. E15-1 TaxID=2919918 RepID=UPI001F4FC0F3|nr:TonB-dependent receptor [Pontibacter sp. E15-1]MCJ8163233.1 TonB-dependent receptor [Pontibacter sp. E15-1]
MLLLLNSAYSFGQSAPGDQAGKVVTGKVTDTGGEPLPGVTVMVQGTATGTVTGADGAFEIKAASGNTLVFRYIGFKSSEVPVADKAVVDVVLQSDMTQLEEVVVVGYGEQKKSHLTGSVARLENKNMEQIAVSRVDQAMQGQIAGVKVQNTTSEVGEAPEISIRGVSSISAGSSPLVVVDGYPTNDGLEFVNAASIASIEVLKDASSTAIYGSRGANGVILVTTKEGKENQPSYNFQSSFGVKSFYKKEDVMDAYEYTDMLLRENQLIENAKATRENREAKVLDFSSRERMMRLIADNSGVTDWQDEATRDITTMKSYLMNVSGGGSNINYFISGQYVDDQGMLKDNTLERFNLSAKVNAKLNKKVRIGLDLKPTYTTNRKSSVPYADFTRTHTWSPVRHNAYTSAATGYGIGEYAHGRHYRNIALTYTDAEGNEQTVTNSNIWGTGNNNPISRMENEWRVQDDYRLVANSYLQWDIIKNLRFKTTLGTYIKYRDFDRWRNSEADDSGLRLSSNSTLLSKDILNENTLNYNWEKAKHSINALGGFTYQYTDYKYSSLEGSQQPTDYVPTVNAATTINLANTYTLKEEDALISYLGRVNYAYDDRYLLSVAMRTDGSSRFGDERKYGWFPSASLGWNIANEAFWADKLNAVNQFKMRFSVGLTGNNNIDNYVNVNTLSGANYVFGDGIGSVAQGLGQINETISNDAITWEKTLEFDYGIDLGFFSNRLSLTADYYQSVTQDLLYMQNITATSGYRNFWNNVGRVENKGIELSLNAFALTKPELSWQIGGNLAANKNKLLSVGGAAQFINTGERGEQYISKVGEQMVQFYGYKMIGVWQNQDEINANPHSAEDAPGGIRVADVNNDGVIDAKDRIGLGSPFPDFTWGFTNRVTWKSFDLSIVFEGSQGAEVFSGDGYYTETRYLHHDFTDGRWFSPDYAASKPREKNGRDWVNTDYLVQDASYVSLRSAVLGYSVPQAFAAKMKLENIRVYFSGYNLLYLMADDYTGLNPEGLMTSGVYQSPLIVGYQRGAYPVQRTLSMGVDLKF